MTIAGGTPLVAFGQPNSVRDALPLSPFCLPLQGLNNGFAQFYIWGSVGSVFANLAYIFLIENVMSVLLIQVKQSCKEQT